MMELVTLDYHLGHLIYKWTKSQVKIAKPVKGGFKALVGRFYSNKAMLKLIEKLGVDGVIYGHIHTAGIKILKDKHGRETFIINTGDWQESADCAVVVNPGELPQILDYKKTREKLGFGDLPDESDPHPEKFAAFRWQTDRQIRLIHTLWPAKNREKLMHKFVHERKRIAANQEIRDDLTMRLQQPSMLAGALQDADFQEELREIFERTKKDAYKHQKAGMAAVFDRAATGQTVTEEDLLFVRTVLRDLISRSDRKIREHEEELARLTKKLDFPRAKPPATPPDSLVLAA